MRPIIVINPNSTQAVTDGIDRAIEPLRTEGGPPIECLTLAEGPPGIESQEDVDAVVSPLCDLIREREPSSSAFVIACYSDPGLPQARESTSKPVFGIAESAMLVALTRGARFGVISILEDSIPRHSRYVRKLGLQARLAGDRAIGLGVTELANDGLTFRRLISVGTHLRDEDGADVLIMGCAGMARYRDRLEATVGLPVIDPTQAAVTLAIGAVLLRSATESA
ncbi:MAG: aspartate/glutamate racemase family protein [Gemmatimonadales bacterium]|jgi:Asp/Glu/hydantoin racemase